jgi:hypothetical protein
LGLRAAHIRQLSRYTSTRIVGRTRGRTQRNTQTNFTLFPKQVSEKKQQYLPDQFGMLHDAVTKFGKKDYLMLVCSSKVLAHVLPHLVLPIGPFVRLSDPGSSR